MEKPTNLIVGTRSISTEEQKPLPLLRQDIEIRPGPEDSDGSPTYNIYDPVRAQYYMISWGEALILEHLRPGMTITDLIEAVHQRSTVRLTEEGLKGFFQEAERLHLLSISRYSDELNQEANIQKVGIFKWLLYHYLYIRIPLINPDAFLTRTLKYVEPFFSRKAFLLYAILSFVGLIILANRWEEFFHTFTYFFTLEGLLLYGITISVVKIIHEFSHAYVAKHYGIYVPTMGVAFIVMWPVLYTDVTDAWKLTKRSQRFFISAAGIIAETVVAGICTWGWALSSPGILQSLFFVVASVTWLSTIFVNTNPAMRFDGYYLLCDLWGIDNLQQRAFAISRWQIRKWLLGLDIPPPEEFSTKRRIGMLIYSAYTWIYRLILYTTVAAFVYYEFTKILGIILFVLEIGVFIIWPFVDEIEQITKLKSYLTINYRSIVTIIASILIVLWAVLPISHMQRFPSLVIPSENQNIYVPEDALIESIYVKIGDKVQIGQPLIRFSSKYLETDIKIREVEKAVAEREILIAEKDEGTQSLIAGKKIELAAIKAQLAGLAILRNQMTVKATMSGIVYQWDEGLAIGQSLAKNQSIGKIANLNRLEVLSFVPQIYIKDIQEGKDATFILRGSFTKLKGKVTQISPAREEILDYPQLASTYNGDIPVLADKSGQLHTLESIYQVRFNFDHSSLQSDQDLHIGQVGDIELKGPRTSKMMNVLRYVESIFLRESGF